MTDSVVKVGQTWEYRGMATSSHGLRYRIEKIEDGHCYYVVTQTSKSGTETVGRRNEMWYRQFEDYWTLIDSGKSHEFLDLYDKLSPEG